MSKKKDPIEVRDEVYFEVGDYDVQSDLRLNPLIYNPAGYSFRQSTRSNLRADYVELSCTIIGTDDKKRLAAPLSMTLAGVPDDVWYSGRNLEDLVRRDKDGIPVLKKSRGAVFETYDKPDALGSMDKVRGEKRWTCYLHLPESYVRDILALFYAGKQVYGSVTEFNKGRYRVAENVSFSTKHPDEQ